MSTPTKLESIIIIAYSTFIFMSILGIVGRKLLSRIYLRFLINRRTVECLLNRDEFRLKRHKPKYFYFYDESSHEWVFIDNTLLLAKEERFFKAADCLDKIKGVTGVS